MLLSQALDAGRELVRQELWGVVLAYNLLRFMMAQMAYSLEGVEPYQLGFKQSALYLKSQLSILPGGAPGRLPRIIEDIMSMAAGLVLPVRRQRHYPRPPSKAELTSITPSESAFYYLQSEGEDNLSGPSIFHCSESVDSPA